MWTKADVTFYIICIDMVEGCNMKQACTLDVTVLHTDSLTVPHKLPIGTTFTRAYLLVILQLQHTHA